MKRPEPASLHGRQFDLVVIGGGVNGAAITRDAALRGLSVLLLEDDDFASGTTSWSTRLIHGGLRYLEHREVGLVRESLRERERLLRNAPHLVKALQLHLPIYRQSKRGATAIHAGLWAYDALSFDSSLPRHRMLSRGAAMAAIPGIDDGQLEGAAVFYDAQVQFPERLVIEQLLDAAASGATILNHAGVTEIVKEGFVTRGVRFVDQSSGVTHEVGSGAVINVAGPWVDHVLTSGTHVRPGDSLIGGTKGTHCFLRMPADCLIPPIYSEARSDGRPFFILPWNGFLMIGTTDTTFAGDPGAAVATPEEVAYLIAETRILLPGADLSADDLRFTYAGIRPLPRSTTQTTSGITRRHFIVDHAPTSAGLFSVVGGKLTTHRSLAEDAVNRICDVLRHSTRCSTANRTLPGARAGDIGLPGIETRAADRLRALYGSRARDIAALVERSADLAQPLTPDSAAIGAEIVHAFEAEMAVTLTDVMVRRTMLVYAPDLGMAAAEAAIEAGKRYLGWNDVRAARERSGYLNALGRFRPAALTGPSDRPTVRERFSS